MLAVYIQWQDSMAHGSTWRPKHDLAARAARTILDHQTIGFLVHEDEHSITLAGSTGAYNHTDARQIPKTCITSRHEIELPR